MTFVLPFPNIDPILLSVGPLAIRWYALAYIAGLLLGWQYMKRLAKRPPQAMTEIDVDDFLVWATLGVVLGGRFGYVLFYNADFYLANPGAALRVWEGGMSFHGGLLGVLAAGYIFVRRRGLKTLAVADLLAVTAPIGIFFGRVANFINGELFGRRVTDPETVPWSMVFPHGGPLPRHPSQLYEAALEGLLLFVVMHLLWRNEAIRARHGLLCGVFLVGYALARSFVELFREPDAHIGLLGFGLTMGQILSAPMLMIGLFLIFRAKRVAS
ncbi:MAG: prolipoprotein diacylglyceryl transferase [Rhodospirillales bacterium]|nr:prolipoprotein diacylglyceryl transferase [Rhodospirillales bacterium]